MAAAVEAAATYWSSIEVRFEAFSMLFPELVPLVVVIDGLLAAETAATKRDGNVVGFVAIA
jgi:hypothetical protein